MLTLPVGSNNRSPVPGQGKVLRSNEPLRDGQLKINPLYAILSGFEFGDTPGVGTFYDFLNRLWDSDSDNLSPHIHPTKDKAKKPKIKRAKTDPSAQSVREVTLKSIESRKDRCIQEGVLGLGPKTEYLSRMNTSVKERSRFQNRSMISQVEWEIELGTG